MGFIYENPEEYAKTCKIDLEIAKTRCNYYLSNYEKAEKVKCPSCNATNEHLHFDNDGSDFPTETFIMCDECGETFEIGDERLKDWYNYQMDFDVVLSFGISGVPNEDELGCKWEDFVKNDTKNLLEPEEE